MRVKQKKMISPAYNSNVSFENFSKTYYNVYTYHCRLYLACKINCIYIIYSALTFNS